VKSAVQTVGHREAHNTFWTCAIWNEEADMRAVMLAGFRRTVTPRPLDWCDEASVAHSTQDAVRLPPWDEICLRMQRDGRPSKVRHPSEAHQRFEIAAPQVRRTGQLRFK
jgi:hypothetical protein